MVQGIVRPAAVTLSISSVFRCLAVHMGSECVFLSVAFVVSPDVGLSYLETGTLPVSDIVYYYGSSPHLGLRYRVCLEGFFVGVRCCLARLSGVYRP